jgi:PAS domain S-box-containing protein
MHDRTGIDPIEQLRESEEQFRLIAENLPGLCWISDREGNLLWGNREWHGMFDGTSAEQGDPTGICHPDDQSILHDLWRRMRAVGETEAVQLRLRGHDNIYRPFLSKAVPIHNATGDVVRWCGVQIDLSDQHAHDRRQTVLRAFHEGSRDLVEPAAILEVLSRILSEHLGVPHLLYGEIGDGEGRTPDVFHAAAGVRQSDSAQRYLLNEAFSTVSGLDDWFESLVVEDNKALGRNPGNAVQRSADMMGTRSAINVPIIKEGKSVAMIAVLDVVPRRWTRDEIELCEELGERAWAAIARARAEAALQERERGQAFLIEWSDAVRGQSSPQAIMSTTLEWLGRHLGVARATYSESDETGRTFSILGEWRDEHVMSIADTSFSLDTVGETVEREWTSGAVVRYDDVPGDQRMEPAVVDSYAQAQILAFVSVPLIEDGRVRSALSVQHDRPRPWRESEIQLIRDVAERTWVMLERARAEAELLERERHQTFLIDWSDHVRGETSEHAIMATTLEWLGRHLGNTRTTYADCDADGRFTVTDEWHDHRVTSVRGNSFHLQQVGAAVDQQWSAGEVVRYDDVATDPRLEPAAASRYADAQIAAFVSIRLIQGGKLQSALSVQHDAPRHWRDDEIQLMRDIAERTWVALERARVQATLEQRERNQRFLLGWNDEVRRETSPQAIMQTTLERIADYLGVTRATYSESDGEGRVFTVRGEWRHGVPSNLGKAIRLGNFGQKVDSEWLSGELVCYNDVTSDPRVEPPALKVYAEREVRAFISVPILQGGAMRSILSVHDREPRQWRDDELQLMRDLAERAWIMLERAYAEAALKVRERNQSFLLEWNDRVSHETSARGILAQTLAAIGEHLGVERTNFAEASDDGQFLCVEQEWRDGMLSTVNQRYALAALGQKLAAQHSSGQPVRVDDTHDDPLFDDGNRPMFDQLGIRAVLTLPMIRAGEIVAVLSAQQGEPRHWTDSEVELVRDLADRTLAVIERAHSEERLAENEARLSAFLENAPVSMHLKDENGRYLRVNPEFAKAMGRTQEELIGTHPNEIFPERIAAELMRLEGIAQNGSVASAEIFAGEMQPDKYVLSMVFPITGAGAARTGGFTLDLTERKRAEAALAKSREALYQTEKLTALGSLLAGVSHELNNPLSIVVAQAVMMERQSRGSELAERAQKIRKAADRCARIVQTFLAMARQKRPEREPVDLNAVAIAAYDLAEYGLKNDGIIATRDLAPGLPKISADADQLHQIIINLIVNAQQALVEMGAPDRALTLRTVLGEAPDTVILEVADNGPGIPDEARRRVFEPFYTTKAQGQGTGVGLSFSQGLAEAHGGRLDLVPTPRGACFRLTLPIDLDPAAAVAPAQNEAMGKLPLRVALVVDDEREIAESLADFLSLEGFSCDIAVGATEAQGRLAAGSYDLIVSDLRMPGIDGPALYAWIAAERPDLLSCVAFATGDTLGAAAARFLDEVKRPVLEKPFTPDAVHHFLQQMDFA